MAEVPNNYADLVKSKRLARGWTQAELAEKLGMTNVTISRWETGRVEPQPDILGKISGSDGWEIEGERGYPQSGDAAAGGFHGRRPGGRAMVEGERLTFRHRPNPGVSPRKVSQIDALPHQRIAVYEHMLKQPRLRFLLADDAGAGKTIMTGLYIARCWPVV